MHAIFINDTSLNEVRFVCSCDVIRQRVVECGVDFTNGTYASLMLKKAPSMVRIAVEKMARTSHRLKLF